MKQNFSLKTVFYAVFVIFLMFAPTAKVQAQDIIRVTGQVVLKGDNSPVIGVNVIDTKTKRALATTDLDGKFAANVRSDAKLRFSMVGMKSKDVSVNGKKHLTVVLDEENVSLKEVTVLQKRITDKIQPEPTDIEVKGNYFYVKTRVRVPREMFGHDTRLVVQPVLNNITRKKTTLMKPFVYDAHEYNRTQDRLYNYNMNDEKSGDPLAKFITVKSKETREQGRTNDIIGYNDSIYVDKVKDEYSCDIYMAIENYNRILYRDTTSIAHGTVNPLRFLDYSFETKELTDSNFLPKPEAQLRDSKGNVNLRFMVGSAKFNDADPQNSVEIDKLSSQINNIATSKGASIQSLELTAKSSPEGKYSYNITLAKERMDYALKFLKGKLPEDMQRGMKFHSNADVANWKEVAALMRKDSCFNEARDIEDIISKNGSIDRQGQLIKKLPYYKRLVAAKYLPQLRSTEYTLHYSIYRTLTREEIEQLYNEDYKQLSKYEFFKLYRSESDSLKRNKIMRQALEVYPSFMAAANDLSAELTRNGQPDPSLLRGLAGANAPEEVNTNQLVALLYDGQYTEADSLAQFIDDDANTHTMLAVNAVMNGRFDNNFNTLLKTGKRNEVVMLLAMKRDNEALKASQALPDDQAVSHYLRAVCLNRANRPSEALEELKKSFEMDPALKETAKVDGDVNDLLDLNM